LDHERELERHLDNDYEGSEEEVFGLEGDEDDEEEEDDMDDDLVRKDEKEDELDLDSKLEGCVWCTLFGTLISCTFASLLLINMPLKLSLCPHSSHRGVVG
jgi:hypothetical protein